MRLHVRLCIYAFMHACVYVCVCMCVCVCVCTCVHVCACVSVLFRSQEFIKARTSETNFEPLQVGVRNMLDEHNADITSAIQSQISASRIMRDY